MNREKEKRRVWFFQASLCKICVTFYVLILIGASGAARRNVSGDAEEKFRKHTLAVIQLRSCTHLARLPIAIIQQSLHSMW